MFANILVCRLVRKVQWLSTFLAAGLVNIVVKEHVPVFIIFTVTITFNSIHVPAPPPSCLFVFLTTFHTTIFCLFDLMLKKSDDGTSFSTKAVLVDDNECD